MADFESVCAALCLMTQAASTADLPAPLSRQMVSRLIASGALKGLILRDTPAVDAALLERARLLLSRAKSVYECLERYCDRGYEVILPQDAAWPQMLFALGERMPQFLFLKGNKELLAGRKIAVAGSRNVAQRVLKASWDLGARITGEGFCLITGGARGVDTAAELGAINAGGSVVLVPAVPDYELFDQSERLDALESGRLLVVADSLPDDPFSAQRALSRNHTIYALGDAAVAVAPRDGVGGTWRGAADCLHMGCTPVFVPSDNALAGPGGDGLIARGAGRVDLSLPLGSQLFSVSQTDLFSVYQEEGRPCR